MAAAWSGSSSRVLGCCGAAGVTGRSVGYSQAVQQRTGRPATGLWALAGPRQCWCGGPGELSLQPAVVRTCPLVAAGPNGALCLWGWLLPPWRLCGGYPASDPKLNPVGGWEGTGLAVEAAFSWGTTACFLSRPGDAWGVASCSCGLQLDPAWGAGRCPHTAPPPGSQPLMGVRPVHSSRVVVTRHCVCFSPSSGGLDGAQHRSSARADACCLLS